MLRRLGRIAIVLAALAPSGASLGAEYSDQGAKACIDCHGTPTVMGILKTAHAKADDPKTPAAQKQCQSCHGPSATHMQFPMQVSNLHFGKKSKAEPQTQNQACLECHARAERKEWHASAHGFEKVLCSQCHSMHNPAKIVPEEASVSSGCSVDGCHGTLMGDSKRTDFSHAVDRPLGDKGQLTCVGCHDPHGPLSSDRCLDCHAQSPDLLAKQSEKARRYHEVAAREGTECMRCHKGIAHPIPPLVLQQQRDARERIDHP